MWCAGNVTTPYGEAPQHLDYTSERTLVLKLEMMKKCPFGATIGPSKEPIP